MLREYRKSDSPKKLLKEVSDCSESGTLTQDQTVQAFRMLQRMNRTDLSFQIIDLWHHTLESTKEKADASAAVVFLRSCCRIKNMEMAEKIIESAGINLNSLPEIVDKNNEIILSTLLPEMIVGYLINDQPEKSLNVLRAFKEMDFGMNLELSKLLLKWGLKNVKDFGINREIIRILSQLKDGALDDNDSLQLVTSAFAHDISFLKGAVSMETLPTSTDGDKFAAEIAFIGRSNVGKSSLINMVLNKKGLAFTSKTPGKTSEFNYFEVQGKLGPKCQRRSFYFVDLPGVGYAEVSRKLREQWLGLLGTYVTGRANLRLVLHLVDSRHGLLDADKECLMLLENLPPTVQYAIVLTKADKKGGGMKDFVLDGIQDEISKRTPRHVPVLLTSSETREGGVGLWSLMLDAIAGDHFM